MADDHGYAMDARGASWIRRAAVAGAALTTLHLIWLRPGLMTLGATDVEAQRHLPGDDKVPEAQIHGTRAVTIDAPPEDVWPWIAQIGYRRAGWYAFDFADNSGIPSSDRIIPDLQHPEVGEVIGDEGYTIARIEPPSLLLLELQHPHVEWVRKEGLWPRFGHSTWAFVLEPLDGGRRTRLLTRLHYYVPFGFHVVYWPLFELVDYVLQPVMLRNIKRRAEAATSPRASTASRSAT
jgi:hypothetical protein